MSVTYSLSRLFVVALLATACGPELQEGPATAEDLEWLGPIASIQQFATGCKLYGGAPTYNPDTGKIRSSALLACDVEALEIVTKTILTRNDVKVDDATNECHFAKSCRATLYAPNISGNQTWCNNASATYTYKSGNSYEYFRNLPNCEYNGF
jgi:hypothetical protein